MNRMNRISYRPNGRGTGVLQYSRARLICMPGIRSDLAYVCTSLAKEELTKERKSVMISYGLTPSLPTIPSASTDPGIQVPANSTKTPITGAVSSPSLKCILSLEAPSDTGVEDTRRRLREVRNRGSGIRIGQITRISRSDQLPFLPIPSVINPRHV
jgi:hypothetical protein